MTGGTPLRGAGVHHVGIAVAELDVPAVRFAALLDATVSRTGSDAKLNADWCWLATPSGLVVELLAPSQGEGGPIASYLRRRGPGLHHLSLATEDLDACMAWAGQEQLDLFALDRNHAGFEEFFLRPESFAHVLCHVFRELPNENRPDTTFGQKGTS